MTNERLREIELSFQDPYNGPNVADDFRGYAKELIARIRCLENQVFEHDLMIRELTRTLRALEREADEGESWKGESYG